VPLFSINIKAVTARINEISGLGGYMNEVKVDDNAEIKFKAFLDVVLNNYKDKIHSIHITGSALTEDFNPKTSDINSILVLKRFDLKFLEDFAPLGKKFGKKQISSPLIMTPEYVSSSLDVFPIEFLTINVLHKTIFGEDIFNDLKIKKFDLRHQCETDHTHPVFAIFAATLFIR